jgi:hypothetical protein
MTRIRNIDIAKLEDRVAQLEEKVRKLEGEKN